MCEDGPRLGFAPCQEFLDFRAAVLRELPILAQSRYRDHDVTSLVILAAIYPFSIFHSVQITPHQTAGWLLGRVASEWRSRQAPREPTPAVEFDVAPETVYDDDADSQWKIGERDIPWFVAERAVDDLERSLWERPDTEIGTAVDTLAPAIWRLAQGESLQEDDGCPEHLVPVAQRLVAAARQRVLADLGSIGSVKHKRGMTKSPGLPTSGRASMVLSRMAPQAEPFIRGEDGKRQYLSRWESSLVPLIRAVEPAKVGTERDEHTDDRIADFHRPVVKGSTRKNRRSGRMGGSAIIR